MAVFATYVSAADKTKPQYIYGTEESIKASLKYMTKQCDWQSCELIGVALGEV